MPLFFYFAGVVLGAWLGWVACLVKLARGEPPGHTVELQYLYEYPTRTCWQEARFKVSFGSGRSHSDTFDFEPDTPIWNLVWTAVQAEIQQELM